MNRLFTAFAVALLLVCAVSAQVAVAPAEYPKPQFFTKSGSVCSGCTISTYAGGTTTPLETYTDSTGVTKNSTIMTLNSAGYPQNEIWFGPYTYKYILKDSFGSIIYSVDNITSRSLVSSVYNVKSLDGVIYADYYASLNAAITAAGALQSTIIVSKSVPVISSVAIPSTVTLEFKRGGALTCAAPYTLTFNSQIIAPSDISIFPTNCTVANLAQTQVPVEWFGAVGDWNGTTGTDNTAVIQACLGSLASGQCMLRNVSYKTTATLTINKSNVGIGGVSYAITSSTLYSTPSPSKIVIASASADAIQVSGVSTSNTVTYNKFTNFTIQRTVAPAGGTARGLSIQYSYGAIIQGVTSEDSLAGFYFHGVGSQGTGYIANCAATWGYNGFSETSGSMAGFMVDSTDGVPSNSFRIKDSFVANNLGHSGSFTTYGVMVTGASVNDFHSSHVEAATVDYGFWINSTSGSFNASQDIFISEPVVDGAWVSAIYIFGVQGSVTVNGGWLNRHPSSTVGSPIVDIENSSHVEVANAQLYSVSATSGIGIYANNGGSIRILGNDFGANTGTAISFNAIRAGEISSNIINGITATSIISLTASPSNVVANNTVNGTATNGILIDATSTGIKGFQTNQIGDSTLGVVTNKWSDPSNNASVHEILTGSSTLTFTAIAASGQQTQSFNIAGALIQNKGVNCSPQASLGSVGLTWNSFSISATLVVVQMTNITAAPITPNAVTWGCSVTQ